MKLTSNLRSDKWIDILALCVSIFALYLSSKQYKDTSIFNANQQDSAILHDKLSVKPLLDFNLEYTSALPWTGVSIINKGIGPAIIVSMNKKYSKEDFKNWGDLQPFLEHKNKQFWKKAPPYFLELRTDKALLPNDETKLWFTKSKNANFLKADTVLNKLSFTLTYTDIYNDTFIKKFP